MISDLEKTNNSSLDDNEIASLMKTLASNQYKENMTFPKKVLQPFKSLSLTQIASKNDNVNDLNIQPKSEEANETAKHNESNEKIITDNNSENLLHNENINDPNIERLKKEESIESNNSDLPENQSFETSFDKEKEPTDTFENTLSEGEDNKLKNQRSGITDELSETSESSPIGVPIKDKLYTEEEKEDAYQKGLFEAKEKFESEQDDKKSKALKTLYNLIKKLEMQVKIDTNLLEKHLKEEILKIASERVGTAIKEMPAEFLKKIETLANSVKEKGEERVLKLNPEDYKEIAPLFKDTIDLSNFIITPDQNLEHSDLIIELGGISLEDKLSDRYSSNEKQGTRSFKIENLDKPEIIEQPNPKEQQEKSDFVPEIEEHSGNKALGEKQEKGSLSSKVIDQKDSDNKKSENYKENQELSVTNTFETPIPATEDDFVKDKNEDDDN